MKKIILILLIVFAQTANAQTAKTQKLNGKWEGIGHQIDGQSWDIALNFENPKDITINYPSLGCSGIWTLEEANGELSIFKEKIMAGTEKCDQGCEVYLQKINKKQIKVTYYLRSYDPVNAIAEGTIERSKRKKMKQ
jgi:hypothetical protein